MARRVRLPAAETKAKPAEVVVRKIKTEVHIKRVPWGRGQIPKELRTVDHRVLVVAYKLAKGDWNKVVRDDHDVVIKNHATK